jgi:hypothetical protein
MCKVTSGPTRCNRLFKANWLNDQPTENGHRHGEPIGGGGPVGPLACTAVAGGMVLSGVDAWMGVAVEFGCSLAS